MTLNGAIELAAFRQPELNLLRILGWWVALPLLYSRRGRVVIEKPKGLLAAALREKMEEHSSLRYERRIRLIEQVPRALALVSRHALLPSSVQE